MRICEVIQFVLSLSTGNVLTPHMLMCTHACVLASDPPAEEALPCDAYPAHVIQLSNM